MCYAADIERDGDRDCAFQYAGADLLSAEAEQLALFRPVDRQVCRQTHQLRLIAVGDSNVVSAKIVETTG